ncbi:hypothetical protein [Cellulomonas sp. Y8]|uniref:hypothetical protein n=1 Tax=Cellulomonas sp. Y8 TaxID=2591145 RepID=UPI0035281E09
MPPRDPVALAAAVARVAADPALATALGAAGRRHVLAGYGSDRGAAALLGLVSARGTGAARTAGAAPVRGAAPTRARPRPVGAPADGGPR